MLKNFLKKYRGYCFLERVFSQESLDLSANLISKLGEKSPQNIQEWLINLVKDGFSITKTSVAFTLAHLIGIVSKNNSEFLESLLELARQNIENNFNLILIGELSCYKEFVSKKHTNQIIQILNQSNDQVLRSNASCAIGGIAVGSPEKLLPFLLENMKNNIQLRSLYILSFKFLAEHAIEKPQILSSLFNDIVSTLLDLKLFQTEQGGTISETLTALCKCNPELIPRLFQEIKKKNTLSHICAKAVTTLLKGSSKLLKQMNDVLSLISTENPQVSFQFIPLVAEASQITPISKKLVEFLISSKLYNCVLDSSKTCC